MGTIIAKLVVNHSIRVSFNLVLESCSVQITFERNGTRRTRTISTATFNQLATDYNYCEYYMEDMRTELELYEYAARVKASTGV